MILIEPKNDWYTKVIEAAEQARMRVIDASVPERMRFYPYESTYRVRSDGKGTDIYLFGADEAGRSVGVRVCNFSPYLLIEIDDHVLHEFIDDYVSVLENCLTIFVQQERANKSIRTAQSEHGAKMIVSWKVISAIPVRPNGQDAGYCGNKATNFLQLNLYAPQLVSVVRGILEHLDLVSPDARNADAILTALRDSQKYERDDDDETDDNTEAAPKDLHTNAGKIRAAERSSNALVFKRKADEIEPDDDDDDDDVPLIVDAKHTIDKKEEIRFEPYINEICSVATRELINHPTSLRNRLPWRRIYEANVDFVLRFYNDMNIRACELVDILGCVSEEPLFTKMGRANDREYTLNWDQLRRSDDEEAQNKLWPISVLSFDCEMNTGVNGDLPKPESEKVLTVAAVYADPCNDPQLTKRYRVLFQLRSLAFDETTYRERFDRVFTFSSEVAMLSALSEFVWRTKPLITTGWNCNSFDLPYLFDRARVLNIENNMTRWSCRMPGTSAYYRSSAFKTKGSGMLDNTIIKNCSVVDMMRIFQRDYKEESLKLEYISSKYLNQSKEDVAPSQINGLFEKDAESRGKLATYCMQDAELPLRLMALRNTLIEKIELSRTTAVPIHLILERGQQILLKTMFLRAGTYLFPGMHFVFATRPRASKKSTDVTYKGGHVEEPKRNYYADKALLIEDFASLYPSIVSAGNMCFTTFMCADDVKQRSERFALKEDDILKPWVSVDDNDANVDQQPHFVKFAKQPGLLPAILRWLKKKRIEAKKLRDQAKKSGHFVLATVFEMRQLALKVIMNAAYGALGAPSSDLYCPFIAAMVTAYGRWMIRTSKKLVTERYTVANGYEANLEVVYGDSVTGDTPLIIKRIDEKSHIEVIRFEALFEEFEEYAVLETHGKEVVWASAMVVLPMILCERGFVRMQRLIRHACSKKLVRVVTKQGIVDCTEDHSLVLANGREISPAQARVGDLLMHVTDYDYPLGDHSTMTVAEAMLMGLFMTGGNVNENTWKVAVTSTDDVKLITSLFACVYAQYNGYEYVLMTTTDNDAWCKRYDELFFNDVGEKHVPAVILNSPSYILLAFYEYFVRRRTQVVVKGKYTAASVWLLCSIVGESYDLSTNFDVFTLTKRASNADYSIVSIEEIGYANGGTYVYDIETETHHFHVGPGNLVVHNTDSIFVCTPAGMARERLCELGREISKFLTDFFQEKFGRGEWNIVEMEFEKVYLPCMLIDPKRYAGVKWAIEKGRMADEGEIDISGLESERRDSTPLVRRAIKRSIEILMDTQSVETADVRRRRIRDYIGSLVDDFDEGRIAWNELIQSKQLRKPVAAYRANGNSAPVHAVVTERMSRRPGVETPRPGDRVRYVIIESEDPKMKKADMGENPEYAWEHQLKLSRAHYLEQGLHPPLRRMLGPLLAPRQKNEDKKDYDQRLDKVYTTFLNERTQRPRIQHVETTTTTTQSSSLFGNSRPKKRCVLCARVIDAGTRYCNAHTADEIRRNEAACANDIESLLERRCQLMQQCTSCRANFTVESNPARARALAEATDANRSIEAQNPCDSVTCNFFYQRRTNDRLLGKL